QLFSGIDPYGATAFFDQVKYWNPAQRNSQFFELGGMLLVNRIVVLSLSVAIFALCYRKFEFKLDQPKKGRSGKNAVAQPAPLAVIAYRPVQTNSGFKANWLAFVSQCKLEYFTTLKTRVFGAVLVFWLFVLVSEIVSGFSYLESLGSTPSQSTAEALWRFQSSLLPRFITLFLVFFSAEMAWRDDQLNTASFTHASPVANSSLFFARLLALLLLPVTFITVAIGASAGLQWLYGGEIQWTVYLSLYYYSGLPMVCIATLCLFIHSISANKFIGMTLSFAMVILMTTSVGDKLGLEHGMFKFSTSPLMQYSDLIGFGASADAFNGYIKYWLSLSAIMLLLGYGLYRRGVAVPLKQQMILAGKQWGYQGKVLLGVAVLASAFFASSVYHQTNEIAHYQSSADRINCSVGYERNYGQYQHLLSPKVAAIKTRMAFYPEQHRYHMVADYTLVNPHTESLSEILVSTNTTVHFQDVKISGATLLRHDPDMVSICLS
ncbi:MAG: hypothetical protein MJK04_32980, partial [Psychrosphaera sp.]|nr:hypothetical protein [Psychrosphaera sp.]